MLSVFSLILLLFRCSASESCKPNYEERPLLCRISGKSVFLLLIVNLNMFAFIGVSDVMWGEQYVSRCTYVINARTSRSLKTRPLAFSRGV